MYSQVLSGRYVLLFRFFPPLFPSISIPWIAIIMSPLCVTWVHSAKLSEPSRGIIKRYLLILNLSASYPTPRSSHIRQALHLSTTTAPSPSNIGSISMKMGQSQKDSSFLGPSMKGMLRFRYASNSSTIIHGMLICIALKQALPPDYEDSNSFLEAGTWQ